MSPTDQDCTTQPCWKTKEGSQAEVSVGVNLSNCRRAGRLPMKANTKKKPKGPRPRYYEIRREKPYLLFSSRILRMAQRGSVHDLSYLRFLNLSTHIVIAATMAVKPLPQMMTLRTVLIRGSTKGGIASFLSVEYNTI